VCSSALAIRHLEDKFQNQPKVPVLRVFCNHARRQEQTLERLLQTLWWQLVERQQSISYNPFEHQAKSRLLSNNELSTLFLQEVAPIPTVYIIVDGLDELGAATMAGLISPLVKLPSGCKVLLTSRHPLVNQHLFFKQHLSLVIRADKEDIRSFIWSQCQGTNSDLESIITKSGPDNGKELFEEIEQKIIAKAGNM